MQRVRRPRRQSLLRVGGATVTASPGGQFFHAAWNQWDFDNRSGLREGADAWYRRVLFIDPDDEGGGGGTEPGENIAPTASFGYVIDGLTVHFTDTSTDSDGSVVGWQWSFGDGATSTNQSPDHEYAAYGSFAVTLTVTDNEGATGTTTNLVVLSEPPAGIALEVTGTRKGSKLYADLVWSGAISADVDVFRDGGKVATTANDGAYTDSMGKVPPGTFVYKVCEAGTDVCSDAVSVTIN